MAERPNDQSRDEQRTGDAPQELPEREAHKLNHGDKLDAIIPRGTDEESPDRASESGARRDSQR